MNHASPRRPAAKAARPSRTLVCASLAAITSFAAGYFVARLPSAGGDPVVAAARDARDDRRAGAASNAAGRSTGPARAEAPRLASGVVVADPPGPDGQQRRQRAAHLLGEIFQRLARVDVPGLPAEARANVVQPFLAGMVEAVRQTDPGLGVELSQEMQAQLCGGAQPDDRAITLAYLAAAMPEITSPQGFECFFARAAGSESAPLWYMIDAWRVSGHARPAALAALEKTASDSRTLRRLAPEAAQVAARTGSAATQAR